MGETKRSFSYPPPEGEPMLETAITKQLPQPLFLPQRGALACFPFFIEVVFSQFRVERWRVAKKEHKGKLTPITIGG